MNLDSDNFIAETLAKDVGAYGAGRGTTTAGVQRTRALLRRARASWAPRTRSSTAPGLSRGNHVSAQSHGPPDRGRRRRPHLGQGPHLSLAQGGEGTLIRRFTSGVATKRVRAKTGYLDGVSAMAGRVISNRGQHYGVRPDHELAGHHRRARATQDNVVTLLAAGAED